MIRNASFESVLIEDFNFAQMNEALKSKTADGVKYMI